MVTRIVVFILLLFLFLGFGFASNSSFLENPEGSNFSLGGIDFKIKSENKIFNKTFYFYFETNATNFTIEYWVENNLSQVVKYPYNTTNTNQKQFTPKDDSKNYTVLAILYANNISIKDSYLFSRASSQGLPGLQENLTNLTDNVSVVVPENNSCNYSFETYIKDNISISTIYFKFKTNATNYSINYWVEDYSGKIVKDVVETINTNQKQFTPKPYTNIFYIKSQLITPECMLESSRMALFYSSKTYDEKVVKTSSKSSSTVSVKDSKGEPESKIEIKNIDDIFSKKSDELIYEIYRGSTNKRVVYFYLNNEKVGSVEVPKYTKLKGRILLLPREGLNNLTITGLDLHEELVFNASIAETTKKEGEDKESISKFKISGYEVKGSDVVYSLKAPVYEIIAQCYVTYVKTKISNVQNFTHLEENVTLRLSINESKLKAKDDMVFYPLNLICRYKKPHSTYYSYESVSFNYTIKKSFEIVNLSQITSDYKEPLLKDIKLLEPGIVKEEVVFAENYKTKEESFYFVFIGSSLILSVLVLRW